MRQWESRLMIPSWESYLTFKMFEKAEEWVIHL